MTSWPDPKFGARLQYFIQERGALAGWFRPSRPEQTYMHGTSSKEADLANKTSFLTCFYNKLKPWIRLLRPRHSFPFLSCSSCTHKSHLTQFNQQGSKAAGARFAGYSSGIKAPQKVLSNTALLKFSKFKGMASFIESIRLMLSLSFFLLPSTFPPCQPSSLSRFK